MGTWGSRIQAPAFMQKVSVSRVAGSSADFSRTSDKVKISWLLRLSCKFSVVIDICEQNECFFQLKREFLVALPLARRAETTKIKDYCLLGLLLPKFWVSAGAPGSSVDISFMYTSWTIFVLDIIPLDTCRTRFAVRITGREYINWARISDRLQVSSPKSLNWYRLNFVVGIGWIYFLFRFGQVSL